MYKIHAEESLQNINVVIAPHLEKKDLRELISNYERASTDILDKFNEDDLKPLGSLRSKLNN